MGPKLWVWIGWDHPADDNVGCVNQFLRKLDEVGAEVESITHAATGGGENAPVAFTVMVVYRHPQEVQ